MVPTLMDVKLPKFEVSVKFELKDIMERLGVRRAFATEADFTLMSDNMLSGIGAIQANRINVSEKGVEAASATATSGGITSPDYNIKSPEPKKFYADKPFIFMLRETSTNAILMIGAINDPKVSE